MRPDPNYPRMMFHRSNDPVTVYSEEQEAALGAEWSRTIVPPAPAVAALPAEHKPIRLPSTERDPDPEQEPEQEEEPEEHEPAEGTPQEAAPAPKPKRGRTPAHQPPHRTTVRKRG